MQSLLFRISTAFLAGITCFAQLTTAPTTHVTVRHLVFDDTVGLTADVERAVEHTVRSRAYDDHYASVVVEIVRDALQQHGYFKAAVLDPVKFTTVKDDGKSKLVDARVIVTPGEQYSLGSISFSGVTAFPSSQLRQQFPIADGGILDVEQIRRGIKAMKDLYCTKGYINFTPIPDFSSNAAARRVAFKVDVDEGQPYRVGKLAVEGEESVPGARRRLLDAWKKYEGRYDCNPIADMFRDLHARPNLPLDKIVEMKIDNDYHTVNYVLKLGRPERRGVSQPRR